MSAALDRILALIDECLGYDPRPIEGDEGPDEQELEEHDG